MSSEGSDGRQMDKGPGSSLHGYLQDAYSGPNQPNPAVTFSQGESHPLAGPGLPSGIPQFFPSNSQNVIHPGQFHQWINASFDPSNNSYSTTEPQPLVPSEQPSGMSQFFPTNSQNSIHPEQLQQGMRPNLGGPFPYGQPQLRGSIPSNDYQFPVSNLPPEHRLSSMVQSAPAFPYTQNLLAGGIGAMPPQPQPQPPLPPSYPMQQPYPMPAYAPWQQNPTAASGFLSPQEIQFQGVVSRHAGQSSNQLPYQNFQQQGYPGMYPNPHQMMGPYLPENNIPSAEPELGAWVDPTLPPRPLRNSYYDPKYEEMGLPVDPHLRNFLAKHGRGNS